MGIAYFIKDMDDRLVWWLTFLASHLILYFYFAKVHRFIFRKSGFSDTMAIVLGIFGVGLGQAYNRQLKKALIFLGIFSAFVAYGHFIDPSQNYSKIIAFVLYILYIIEAARGTKKAARNQIVDNRRKEVEQKAKTILQYKESDHEFAVDTNILMHEPDLLLYLLEKAGFKLYMSMMVFSELDGLKKSDDIVTRTQAQTAFDVIEEFQRHNKLKLLKTPKTDQIRKYGLGGSPDEKIIGTYMLEREKNHPKLMFISNDKGARILARNAGIPIVEF